jgi:hypothetical protein
MKEQGKWTYTTDRQEFARIRDENGHVVCKDLVPSHALKIARAVNSHDALVEACTTVKAFLDKLVDCDTDDPLCAIRRKFHAPLHLALDKALTAAEEPKP